MSAKRLVTLTERKLIMFLYIFLIKFTLLEYRMFKWA